MNNKYYESNNSLRPRDYVELSNLIQHAQAFLHRAQFILGRSGSERAVDLKAINYLLRENAKRLEVEAARRFLTPNHLKIVRQKHRWKQSANLTALLKY